MADTAENIDILNIGTEVMVKDVMDQYLRSLGNIRTFYAASIPAAVDTYMSKTINIVFCELHFLKGSAQSFIQAINGLNYADDPYFVLVDTPDEKERSRPLMDELYISHYLAKPFSAQDVLACIEQYKNIRSQKKEEWRQHLIEARLAIQNKRYQEADFTLKKLMKSNSEDPEITLEYARFLFQKPDLKNAELSLRKVLALNPNHIAAMHLLGKVAVRLGKVVEGVELLEKAQNLSPLNEARLNDLSDAYLKIAQLKTKKVLDFDHQNPQGNLNLIKIMLMNSDYRGALIQIERSKNYFDEQQRFQAEAYLKLCKKLGGFQ